jgi:hypothetical protein
MAMKLKEACVVLFADPNFFGNKEEKEKECAWSYLGPDFYSCRSIMIWLGTKVFRNTVGENFWTVALKHKLIGLRDQEPRRSSHIAAVIDDIRFVQEATMVNELGICVLVKRSGVDFSNGIADSQLPPEYIQYTIDLDDPTWLDTFMDHIHPTVEMYLIQLDTETSK